MISSAAFCNRVTGFRLGLAGSLGPDSALIYATRIRAFTTALAPARKAAPTMAPITGPILALLIRVVSTAGQERQPVDPEDTVAEHSMCEHSLKNLSMGE
jgi:hypothetical protein